MIVLSFSENVFSFFKFLLLIFPYSAYSTEALFPNVELLNSTKRPKFKMVGVFPYPLVIFNGDISL